MIFILDFAVKFYARARQNRLSEIELTDRARSCGSSSARISHFPRLSSFAGGAGGARHQIVRVLTSLNRGMKSLGASFGRRGFGYVIALSLIVVFVGAAGMLAFENEVEGGIKTYGDALWWTAMMITTIGSEYFPRTAEGRVLCFILALYGFAVFGYVMATLATFFVGRDAENKDSEIVGAEDLNNLKTEISALREGIKNLSEKFTANGF